MHYQNRNGTLSTSNIQLMILEILHKIKLVFGESIIFKDIHILTLENIAVFALHLDMKML